MPFSQSSRPCKVSGVRPVAVGCEAVQVVFLRMESRKQGTSKSGSWGRLDWVDEIDWGPHTL